MSTSYDYCCCFLPSLFRLPVAVTVAVAIEYAYCHGQYYCHPNHLAPGTVSVSHQVPPLHKKTSTLDMQERNVVTDRKRHLLDNETACLHLPASSIFKLWGAFWCAGLHFGQTMVGSASVEGALASQMDQHKLESVGSSTKLILSSRAWCRC